MCIDLAFHKAVHIQAYFYNHLLKFFLQLSHYLDITEVNLAHQISLRSEDFFSAMASQDQLQDHVGETVSEIKHLR